MYIICSKNQKHKQRHALNSQYKNKMVLTNVVGKDKLVVWYGKDLYIM